jgi:hypothetical protein
MQTGHTSASRYGKNLLLKNYTAFEYTRNTFQRPPYWWNTAVVCTVTPL